MKWVAIGLGLVIVVAVGAWWYDGHRAESALLALLQDMVATARKLKDRPGDACFRFWFPDVAGPPDIAQAVDAQSQKHTLDLMSEVIRSAAENPVPQPEADAVKDSLAEVVNGTYEQFGPDAQMLGHAKDPRVDRTKVCGITIGFYERVLSLPPDRAAALVRVMAQ